jgi:hypothetical protein
MKDASKAALFTMEIPLPCRDRGKQAKCAAKQK